MKFWVAGGGSENVHGNGEHGGMDCDANANGGGSGQGDDGTEQSKFSWNCARVNCFHGVFHQLTKKKP